MPSTLRNPGMAVGEAPHHEGFAVWSSEAYTEHFLVELCLPGELFCHRSMRSLYLNIHLGDLHLQSEGSEAVHIGKYIVRCWVCSETEMHLQTNARDGHTTFEQTLHKSINRIRLAT